MFRSSVQYADPLAFAPTGMAQPYFMELRPLHGGNLPAVKPNFFSNLYNRHVHQAQASLTSQPIYFQAQQQHSSHFPQSPLQNPWQPLYGAFETPRPFTQPQPMPHYNQWKNAAATMAPNLEAILNRKNSSKTSLWEQFRHIYITEVVTFNMSKSTLFTLVFSFMFLGCIFFLTGFFTAASIYRNANTLPDHGQAHQPSQSALLQGRPQRPVNMAMAAPYGVPRSYQPQGAIANMEQNIRRPSRYVEQQASQYQPRYR